MFYIITILFIFLDLATKQLAKLFLDEKIPLIWDILYLKFAQNPWMAFWVEIPTFLLKIITISLIILIFYYYIKEEKKKNNKLIDFSFWLILAWAIWNGIERVFNSTVIDFIWVKYFAIFNLADCFLTIGVILYIYSTYKSNK